MSQYVSTRNSNDQLEKMCYNTMAERRRAKEGESVRDWEA